MASVSVPKKAPSCHSKKLMERKAGIRSVCTCLIFPSVSLEETFGKIETK